MSRPSFPAPVLLLVLALPASARADLECAEPIVQVGEVRAGAPLAHRFVFVNRGPDVVEITDVRPSCGCLVPRVESRILGPGEEGTLLLEVNTLTQPAGPNNWRLPVRYRAGERDEELTLFLSAHIVAEILVQPPVLALYLGDGPGLRHTVTITDRRDKPLTVTIAQASASHVRTRLLEPHADSAGHRVCTIEVEVLDSCPEGRHEDTLHLFTSDPGYPELKVPLTIVKRAPGQVTATPASVEVSASPGQAVPARMVVLGSSDGRAVTVEGAEADDPAVQCRWAAGPGTRATLAIRIDRGHVVGSALRTAVHVRLSGPVPQTLTIPVRCTLR
jgi:hypothetical protein